MRDARRMMNQTYLDHWKEMCGRFFLMMMMFMKRLIAQKYEESTHFLNRKKNKKAVRAITDEPSARSTHKLNSKKSKKAVRAIKHEPSARSTHFLNSKKTKRQSEQ